MVRRSAILLIEVVAATIAGAAIAGALFAWRLAGEEPVHLRFLTPYLERALNPPGAAFRIEIGDTVLAWGGWERALDLTARDVRAFDAEGDAIATIPALSLALSGRALLRGVLAPTALDIFGAHLFVVREADGRLRFVRADAAGGQLPGDEPSPLMPTLLGELLKPPEEGSATGYFTSARMVGATIDLDDRRLGVAWRIPKADIEFRRDAVGIAGTIGLEIEGLGRPANFAASFAYDRGAGTVALDARISNVDMAALGLIEPSLVILSGADLVIGGSLTTRVRTDGTIGPTDFQIAGGPGQFTMPGELEGTLDVRSLRLAGRLDAGLNSLSISEAEIDFGGPAMRFSGTASGLAPARGPAGPIDIAGTLEIGDVPVPEIGRYWPLNAAASAREWVTENIVAGTLDRLDAALDLRLPAGAGEEPVIRKAEVAIAANAMTIHYFRPMPPIVGIDGKARLDENDLAVVFTGGGAAGVAVEGGTLAIAGLDGDAQYFTIEADLAGSMADVVRLLDSEPMRYAERLGLADGAMAGRHATKLHLEFPNEAEIGTRTKDLKVRASSKLTGIGLSGLMFGQGLSDGDLDLDVDNEGMRVAGKAKLAGVPADLTWTERFGGEPYRTRIAITATLDAPRREAFGLDLKPYLDGPVPAGIVYTVLDDTRAELGAEIDLTDASLGLPFLQWSKQPGEAGQAKFELELRNGRPAAIRSFDVAAGTLAATGRARFTEKGDSLAAVEFERLKVGRTALDDVAADFASGFVRITAAGGELDAEPLMADEEEEDEPRQPFSLRAEHLTRVYLPAGHELTDVRLALRHDGAFWDRIEIDASPDGKGRIAVRFEPLPSGNHGLVVGAEDAGQVLKTFDITEAVEGGALTIRGETDNRDPRRPLKGKIAIDDFRLVQAPVLARLLAVATLTGLVDVFTGEGFLFQKMRGEFVKTGGLLEVPRARAHGPSIGITATGTVDFDADKVDLDGTIVPAYALNSLIGDIPLIGEFLQGGEGEGLFAATYTATGSLDQPEIDVNPLAALAPGFLRGIFEGGEGGEGGDETYVPLPRGDGK